MRQKARTKNPAPPYADLRSRLIQRGFTLRSFALTYGYPVGTVYCAARGLRAGVKSTRITNHLAAIAYAE